MTATYASIAGYAAGTVGGILMVAIWAFLDPAFHPISTAAPMASVSKMRAWAADFAAARAELALAATAATSPVVPAIGQPPAPLTLVGLPNRTEVKAA